MSTTGQARDPRPSRLARAAGLAFLPLPLVPFLAGLGTLLRDPTRPGSGCFEYCAADRDGGRIALVLGVIGIWIAVLIWRRHVAAMALALFVSALLTAIWLIGFVVPILTGGYGPMLLVILAIGVVPLVLDGLLVAAMREEMNRAGEAAARQVPIEGTAPPPPLD